MSDGHALKEESSWRSSCGKAAATARFWRRRRALLLVFCLLVWLGPPSWAAAAETVLEELHFRIDVLLWSDAGRGQLVLKRLDQGRYLVELSGYPQGFLRRVGGERKYTYQTEMAWRDGRLMPLVYREQSVKRGQPALKEYRFDYAQGRLEMWELNECKELTRKWEGPLNGPIYDPLSGFYNCRLEVFGPVKEGAVYKVTGIPYPKPSQIEVKIGEQTPQGRKATITIANQIFRGGKGEVFVILDDKHTPKQAWMTMYGGKINGEVLPGGKPLKESLMQIPQGESRPPRSSLLDGWAPPGGLRPEGVRPCSWP